MLLEKVAMMNSGQAQFRIKESMDSQAPLYNYYTQSQLEQDLYFSSKPTENKQIRTFDDIQSLVATNDVIFSLISGKAAQVSAAHNGFLYTQNYVKLTPNDRLDPAYLVYLLNEHQDIRKQFSLSLQGSQVLKYTTNQLKTLHLPEFPSLQVQRLIGEVYKNQRKLTALKQQVAEAELQLVLQQLKGANIK